MSKGGDVPELDLDVLDAAGERVGRREGVPLTELARRLPVTLDDDAKGVLGVDEDSVDLPAQLIRRRGSEELELSKNLADLKELIEGLDLDEVEDA